jgi:hypothetical protein
MSAESHETYHHDWDAAQTDDLEAMRLQHSNRSAGLLVALEKKRARASMVADALPFGVLIVDEHGEVVRANAAARTLSEGGTVVQITNNFIRWTTPNDTSAMTEAMDVLEKTREAFFLAGTHTAQPFVVAVDHIVVEDDILEFGRRFTRIRTFTSCLNKTNIAPALTSAFVLTKAEADFAIAYAVERDVAGAAGRRCISLNTARGYMKQLFQKTGTNRQSQLMRLLVPLVRMAK